MPVINQVAAADTYPATKAVIQNVYRPKGGWFSVGSFPAFVQLQYALPGTRSGLGNNEWKDEELVGAGAFGFIPADAIGIRFRNANAGSNAVITASLSQGPEPALAIVALGNVTTSGRAPTQTILAVAGSGTYVPPAQAVAILVELIGGGGAGGGNQLTGAAQAAAGGGGSGGNYASSLIASPAAAGYAYTVGAGGVGVAGANGGAGGDTSFGAGPLILAKGGAGGSLGGASGAPVVSSNAAPPQTGDVGSVIVRGGPGGIGFALGIGTQNQVSGQGGDSARGGSGGAQQRVTGPGVAGSAPGGGGSGSAVQASSAASTGGGGGSGQIVITEFY